MNYRSGYRFLVRASLFLFVILLVSASGTAQEIIHELTPHEGSVNAVAFLPGTDHAVSGGNDGLVQLHSLKTGKPERRLEGHTAPVYCMQVSPDGRMLATGAQDNTVRLWNLPATRALSKWPSPEKNASRLVCLNEQTAIVGATGAVQFDRGKGTMTAVKGIGANVVCSSFSSNGTLLTTGSQSGEVVVWSTLLNKVLFRFKASNQSVVGIHLSGTTLVTVDSTGGTTVWQTSTLLNGQLAADQKELPQTRQFDLGVGTIHAVDFCRTSIMIASGESHIGLVDFNSGKEVRRLEVQEPTGPCAIRPDAQRVACATKAGISVFNAGSGQKLQHLPLENAQADFVSFSNDGRRLVATAASQVHLFEPATTSTTANYEFQQTFNPPEKPSAVGFSGRSSTLYMMSPTGELSEWPVEKVGQIAQLAHSGAVYGMAISSDRKQLVTCGADQTVRVWELPLGRLRYQMRGHQGAIHAVALNAENTLAVTAGADGTIRLWDVTGGRQLKELTRLSSTMYSVSFRGTDQLLAGGGDRQIHVLNPTDGTTLKSLVGHKDYIHGVVSVPQSKGVVSVGYSGQLRIWGADLTNSATYQVGQTGNCLDVSDDGNYALVGDSDGVTRYLKLSK